MPLSTIASAFEKRSPASVTTAQPTGTSSRPSDSPVSGSIISSPAAYTCQY